MRHPDLVARVREDVKSLAADNGNLSNQMLQNSNLLNGIITETLRLHPPAGLALQRKTPPEGLTIDGIFVPGDITVWCPQYVIGRSKINTITQ